MHRSRLSLAISAGLLTFPPEGDILVLRPRADTDLSALPKDRVVAVQGFRPDHDALAAQGYRVVPTLPQGSFAGAVVCVTRSKAEVRALIAAACAAVVSGGPVAVDGQKTDGTDSVLKDLRARVDLSEAIAKAHGKIAVFDNPGPDAFAEWVARPTKTPEGYVTDAAAFSSDAVDPGSAALAGALPQKLPARVADFGAGWGYLASEVLSRDGVQEVHLIEAEYTALEAARLNISDPRARYHWADATRFVPEDVFGAIVMNPPFHIGRAADPALGRAFIAAAARALQPGGTLWMVANRHLPYERTLDEHFRSLIELPGPPAYKLYQASGVRRMSRAAR